MKKIVLTAAVAAIAMSANAQANAEATSILGAQAQLTEVIILTPASQNSQAQPGNQNQVNTLAQYGAGIDLTENPQVAPGPGAQEFEFTLGASCGYDVRAAYPANFLYATTPGAFAVDGNAYPMPATDLSLQIVPPTGGDLEYNNFSAMTPLAAGPQTAAALFGNNEGHAEMAWGINMHLTPGYTHQGGYYRLPITITASTR